MDSHHLCRTPVIASSRCAVPTSPAGWRNSGSKGPPTSKTLFDVAGPILTPAQEQFLEAFFVVPDADFFLTGGTALAGFDLYWMAQACQKVLDFPGNLSNWQVQMVKPAEAEEVKSFFKLLRKELMTKIYS